MYNPDDYPKHDDPYVTNGLLKTEIDHLRAAANCDSCGKPFDENGGICEPCYSAAIVAHIKPIAAERDSLRAENANLHEQLDTVSEAHNVMAKEGDRLRAEIVALRELRDFVEASIESIDNPLIAMHIRAILAKTAKEGE